MEVSDVVPKKKYNFSIENILTKGTGKNTKIPQSDQNISHAVKEDNQGVDSRKFGDNVLIDTRFLDNNCGYDDMMVNCSDIDIDVSDDECDGDFSETGSKTERQMDTAAIHHGVIAETVREDGGGIKNENLGAKQDRKTHQVHLNVPTAHNKGICLINNLCR